MKEKPKYLIATERFAKKQGITVEEFNKKLNAAEIEIRDRRSQYPWIDDISLIDGVVYVDVAAGEVEVGIKAEEYRANVPTEIDGLPVSVLVCGKVFAL